MPVHLEVSEGPSKGRKIPLNIGKTFSVGRNSAKSMVALPEDAHLSGQHFSVGLRNGSVYLCNLSKVNPTEVNGKQVNSAVLKPGESFKAGLNVFSVIGGENPHEATLRVGGWGFQIIPEGWEVKEGSGLRHSVSEPFRANIIVVEEALPKDYDLAKYVELQVTLGQKHLKDAMFSQPNPMKIKGADDAMALTIHSQAEKGPAVQLQIYAVHAGIVGVMTATALESQTQLLRAVFNRVLPGLTFFQV
jgi:FHA domain-containing protein/DcrB-like protein